MIRRLGSPVDLILYQESASFLNGSHFLISPFPEARSAVERKYGIFDVFLYCGIFRFLLLSCSSG
jgi:hypothetical protein